MSQFDQRLNRALSEFREELMGNLRDSDQQGCNCDCAPLLYMIRDELTKLQNQVNDIKDSLGDSTPSEEQSDEVRQIVERTVEKMRQEGLSSGADDPDNKLLDLLEKLLVGGDGDPGLVDKLIPDTGDVLRTLGTALSSVISLVNGATTKAALSKMGRDLSDDMQRLQSAIKDLGNPAGEVEVSRRLKDIMDAIELCCSNATDNFSIIHDSLDALTGALDDASKDIKDISGSVNAISNNLGDVESAVDSLDETVKDIGSGGEGASGLLSKMQDMINTLRS